MNIESLHTQAETLDAQDELASYREQFYLPKSKHGHAQTYLCGNSLGLQPRSVPDYIQQELLDWQNLGVEGHFHAERPWMPYHELLTAQMARVVGALPDEVVCMNSLTVNLHLMMVSFYRPTDARYKIIRERGAFPSDCYAIDSQLHFHGHNHDALIELTPREGEDGLRTEDILECIERNADETALVLLPGVQYYTGQVLDVPTITRRARSLGCTVGWDLAHSVGNVMLELHNSDADFAVWCNYKYMNSGPGAIGGCFVHERHHNTKRPRFAGWWGQDKASRFKMGPDFTPIQTSEGWQLSNPPILAMAPLLASLAVFDKAGLPKLTAKARLQTQMVIDYLHAHFQDSIELITPTQNPADRGGQLSLRIAKHGKRVQQALIEADVICDWREPDCIRIGFAPLYNSFTDGVRFLRILHRVLDHV
ncbi:MAG: kynureninase [Gammaproteobacteria bacterium]